MKIEKISDNQIRCTLTRADLADRQLQLSELAYGTEKAKSLFRDMMQITPPRQCLIKTDTAHHKNRSNSKSPPVEQRCQHQQFQAHEF